MTKDDIIKLAKAAGFLVDGDSWIHAGVVLIDGRKSIDEQLKRFANLVAAAEREAIAQMFEASPELISFAKNDQGGCIICGLNPKIAVKAIRARGNT
jgi:ribosomal protein L12E/L44/L45/RPP1/RPP2